MDELSEDLAAAQKEEVRDSLQRRKRQSSWVVDYAVLNKGGREPRDACDVLIPILLAKCGRVDAAHLRQRPRNVA